MSSKSLFRTFLITGLAFSALGAVLGEMLTHTLPRTLQKYLVIVDDIVISQSFLLFSMGSVLIYLLLLLICVIGLWQFKRWARPLYVFLTVISVPIDLLMGPFVMNGWEYMFYEAGLLLNGVVLAMMYTGKINAAFSSSTDKKTLKEDSPMIYIEEINIPFSSSLQEKSC